MTLYDVLKYLHPNITLGDVMWDGDTIIKWDAARFGAQPTPEQIEAARAILSRPWGAKTLDAHKAAKIESLKNEANAFGAQHYPQSNRDQLEGLMLEAISENLTARRAYLLQAIAWQKAVAGYWFALRDAVQAQATHEAVESIAFDGTAFLAQHPDPGVTVEAAAGINT